MAGSGGKGMPVPFDYAIWQLAERLGVLPEQIENQDPLWLLRELAFLRLETEAANESARLRSD